MRPYGCSLSRLTLGGMALPQLTVRELGNCDLPAAWPLVRTAAPSLGADRWKSYAEALIGRGGGVIGVSGEDGGLYGVATYEAADNLRAGRVLRVGTLVTMELTRRSPVRRVLCNALDRLAPALQCEAIAISIPKRSFAARMTRNVNGVAGPGSELEEVVFMKRIGTPSVAAV